MTEFEQGITDVPNGLSQDISAVPTWAYKTTPGSDHEYCTVYEDKAGGRAIARHVLPENAGLIAASPQLLVACKAMVLAAKINDPAMGGVAATLAAAAIEKATRMGVKR